MFIRSQARNATPSVQIDPDFPVIPVRAIENKATEAFSTFQSKVSKKHFMHRLAERQIEMCNNAKYQVSHPQNYLISNVGPVINEASNDYSPVISLDAAQQMQRA